MEDSFSEYNFGDGKLSGDVKDCVVGSSNISSDTLDVRFEKKETFSKFRLFDISTGRLVYSLMINDSEGDGYFEDKQREMRQRMSYLKNIPLENLYWEDVK